MFRHSDAPVPVATALVSGPDLATDIANALGGDELRLVADPIGGRAASELIAALEFRGTVVTYGAMTGAATELTTVDLLAREITHTGLWLGNWFLRTPRSEIAATLAALAAQIADGQLFAPVEATYPLDQYRTALDHAEAPHRGGKVLFTF